MRILLDTNILIHREGARIGREDIGILFQWLDKLHATKCIHPRSLDELRKHADPTIVRTMEVKAGSYHQLKTRAPDLPAIQKLRTDDKTPNDEVDTDLLAELASGRVDLVITEDRGIHDKAQKVGLSHSVFSIDSFLEKVTAENPELADYRVLSVRRVYFGSLNLADPFFDSFRRDYDGFNNWFNRKADEYAYVCTENGGKIVAFLYLKTEGPEENYFDIVPPLLPKKRLKIGTFKVVANGFKLGERFLKIIFDNALGQAVEEIYVTAFRSSPDHERLIKLLGDWGFLEHGFKETRTGREAVFVRDFMPRFLPTAPQKTFPYIGRSTRQFIVPIYPQYHTELLPDSILTTESPADFVENKPNRNALSKVYVSRSVERAISPGDLIVFYRTRSGAGPAHYTSVATTLGVVQEVLLDLPDKAAFVQACRKRSVYSDAELEKHWDHDPTNRPFVVNFLHVHTLPKRPNLGQLKAERIIPDAPRGFQLLSPDAFRRLLEISHADTRIIVD